MNEYLTDSLISDIIYLGFRLCDDIAYALFCPTRNHYACLFNENSNLVTDGNKYSTSNSRTRRTTY